MEHFLQQKNAATHTLNAKKIILNMKKFIALFVSVLLFAACDKDFDELNVDPKRPQEVPPGALFSFAQKELVDAMTNSNVNLNIFRLIAQQWTETTYTDESNYDLSTRNIPQNFWNSLYRSVLKNLSDCQKAIPGQDATFVSQKVKDNQNACAEILNVYTYATLVNTFGDVPYTEAINIENVYPKYDGAASIYTSLLGRLDAAIAKITLTEGAFDSNDILYGGDMNGWKTFANTLKLRLGMMLADVDAATAKKTVEAAAAGAISSNADNTVFHYLAAPPNTNPIWEDLVQSGRKDFVAANTVVDAMKAVSDPRIPLYFTKDAKGLYNGGEYGSSNNYATYSKPADAILRPDFEALLADYAEVEFLLAEAKERNMNVPGTAAEHYEAGIRASIAYWGGSTADADAYLARPEVAYATAAGDWKQKIGMQKWFALYNRGFDAWTEIRRFDTPKLVAPVDAVSDVPVRFTYPVQEQTLNADNYKRGSTAIGGDEVTTKLFWDKF